MSWTVPVQILSAHFGWREWLHIDKTCTHIAGLTLTLFLGATEAPVTRQDTDDDQEGDGHTGAGRHDYCNELRIIQVPRG